MTRIALAVYRFFKRYRSIFFLVLLGSFLVFAFLANKMYYEEDITKLLPATEGNSGVRYVFDKLKVKDKIFVLLRVKDSTMAKTDMLDTLISAGTRLCDSLKAHDKGSSIEDILFRVDPSILGDGAFMILDNAPCFLDSTFYPSFEKTLNPAGMDSLMQQNIEILENDGSGMWYDIVCKDPLAFRSIAMHNLSRSADLSDKSAAKAEGSLTLTDFHLFSSDSTTAIIYVTPGFKAMDSKAGTRLIDFIQEEADELELASGVEVLISGKSAKSVYTAKRIKKDLVITVSIAMIFIILIIGYCFRTKDTIFYLLMPLLWGVVAAIAAVYLIQGQMSFIALGIGCIVIGVALSYCIHLITHHKYVGDVEQVIKDQAKPVTLGCITTVGSLLGLIFTKSSLLRDFGLMASFVMVGTTLAAIFFLPQFFRNSTGKKDEKAFAAIEKITTRPYYRHTWLIVLVLLLFVLSVVFTRGSANFDTDLSHLSYSSPGLIKAENLYTQKTQGGMQTKYIAVHSKNLDSALMLNQKVAEQCQILQDKGMISSFNNLSSLLLPLSEQKERIEVWNRYFTPEKKARVKALTAAAAERNGFEAQMFEPFYQALDTEYSPLDVFGSGTIPPEILGNFMEKNDDGTYLVLTTLKAEDNQMLWDASKMLAQGGDNKDKTLSNGLIVIDPLFYTTDMLEIMEHDFNTVLLISSLFVFVILLIALRNIILSVIAFLPMFMSWFLVLGFMKLLNMEFNLINMVISTFIFGMGVDYSIFVMDGLIKGKSQQELLKYHRSAIFFSAVMLILAVSSLLLAVHPAISSIGLSTLAGMVSTILITFTLQPYLYYKWEAWKSRSKKVS
ncbi:MAG: MMPL family transporter [Bacteroidales bacterium]|nr:MMPL family transporter [Bacteroidales bacterium]